MDFARFLATRFLSQSNARAIFRIGKHLVYLAVYVAKKRLKTAKTSTQIVEVYAIEVIVSFSLFGEFKRFNSIGLIEHEERTPLTCSRRKALSLKKTIH